MTAAHQSFCLCATLTAHTLALHLLQRFNLRFQRRAIVEFRAPTFQVEVSSMCAMSFYDSAVWVHVLFQVQQHMQCVHVALWGQLAESVEDATRDVTTQTMELPQREVIP